jgi:hypothetical protein
MRVHEGLSKQTGVVLLALSISSCTGHGVTAPTTAISPSSASVPPVASTASMKGTVSDTAFRSIAGAAIEILNGPSAGLTTTSDARGQWGFAGVFDDSTRFRATKEGYEPAIKPLGPFCAACNPNRWVNFDLKARAAPVNVAGSYAMTITIDPACSNFPERLRTRTYDVTLPSTMDQSAGSSTANAYFSISPTGANFVPGWNQFEGGVSGNYLGFWFETLVEEIAPGNYLMIGMSAGGFVGSEHPTTITTQGDGRIDYCTVDPASGQLDDCFRGKAVTYAQCDSKQHALVMTPR